jgi:hypothetical protein
VPKPDALNWRAQAITARLAYEALIGRVGISTNSVIVLPNRAAEARVFPSWSLVDDSYSPRCRRMTCCPPVIPFKHAPPCTPWTILESYVHAVFWFFLRSLSPDFQSTIKRSLSMPTTANAPLGQRMANMIKTVRNPPLYIRACLIVSAGGLLNGLVFFGHRWLR